MTETIFKTDLLDTLPPEWPEDLLPEIRDHLAAHPSRVVVIDDDPTGTQTVYDTPVLTVWDEESLTREFISGGSLFYILTNSRSLPAPEAAELARELGRNLKSAAAKARCEFTVISRSDSTLRGHYPLEVDALTEALNLQDAVHVICPFFEEGGRLTLGDVHYVADGETLVPAAETPFAKDASFGYSHSNLKKWVKEKSGGRIRAEDVLSLSLETLRNDGPLAVADQFSAAPAGSVVVVNAVCFRDIEVAVLGLMKAEARGNRFICRTGASFVRARAGLEKRPLLAAKDLIPENQTGVSNGGLIVVGSYVPMSTQQLETLLKNSNVCAVELPVEPLLDETTANDVIEAAIQETDSLLSAGQDVAFFTSRKLVTGDDAAQSLAIGCRVSAALVQLVRALKSAPSFLVAKGGITSSDVATKGLDVKRALVRGQIFPGVPVWQLGPESRFPGMNYIVFPGNVGGPDALLEVVNQLSNSQVLKQTPASAS